jgi:hypothetical protein
VEADYNVTVGGASCVGGETDELAWGAHNFAASNPGFVDDRRRDLRLTASSQALSRGSAAHSPATDLDAKRRPTAGAVDAGAYQFGP